MIPQKIRYAQVTEVNYNDESPEDLWIINAIELDSNNIADTSSTPISLVPLDSNIKQMPIKGEIVMWVEGPSNLGDSSLSNGIPKYYYLGTVNIQSFVNHNSNPKQSVRKSEGTDTETENGTPKYGTDEDDQEPLGNTFEESEKVRPLQPYEGDILVEGRCGNSIRFGCTVDRGDDQFPTSTFWKVGDGANGDPILVLRNGQKSTDDTDGGDPGTQKFINENINHDDSSIYLTSTQLIDLNPAWHTGDGGSMTSLGVWDGTDFRGKQIIMNSDRIVLNTKNDSIIMMSSLGIGLSCGDAMTLEADSKIEIESNDVLNLGQDADSDGEPVVLGDTLQELLESLVDIVDSINTNATNHFHPPYGTSPDIVQKGLYAKATTDLATLKGKLSTMKSEYAFVKKKSAGNSASPDNSQNKNR